MTDFDAMVALNCDDPTDLSALLDKGLDPNFRPPLGSSLLYFAAWTDKVGHVHALLRAHADVDALGGPRGYGETALHAAAWSGNVAIVTALLDAGASVNVRSAGGETPLWMALNMDARDVMHALLQHGANPEGGLNKDGHSVLASAVSRRRTRCVRRLIEAGARIDDVALTASWWYNLLFDWVIRVHARWDAHGLRQTWISAIVALGFAGLTTSPASS